MKKRVLLLVKRLLDADGFVTADWLAQDLGLSKRSVLYALDEVDRLLAANGLGEVEREPGKGVRLPQPLRATAAGLLEGAWEADNPIDAAVASDRRLYLGFSFMCVDVRQTTESLAAQLDVSVRTVSNDIARLRSDLLKGGIDLVYDRASGWRMLGNEFSRRGWLISFLQDSCLLRGARDLAALVNGMGRLAKPGHVLLEEEGLGELVRVVEGVLPGAYERDIRHVVLMSLVVAALERSEPLAWGLTDGDRVSLAGTASFELARFLVTKTEECLGRTLDEGEPYYIAMLLQSLPMAPQDAEWGDYPFDLGVVAQKLIGRVGEGYGFDFSSDPELLNSIVLHLMPLTYRMLFRMQISNPLVGDVVAKYGRLHAQVRGALGEVERLAGVPMREDEAAFLTLYFASSIEKLALAGGERPRIAVVCNAGNAVSRLLQYRIGNAFKVEVVAATSERGLYDLLGTGDAAVDYIVSIVELDEARCRGVPVLRVSALLDDADLELLGKHLVRRACGAKDEGEEAPGLLDLLAPGRFLVRPEVSGMDELITLGGQLLARSGLCDDEYPRQMVTMAHSFGPLTTILIAPGIIMPHAGVSEHVYKTGFSFVVLERPVEVNGRPVRCALSVCTRSKRINQRAIQQLGILLRGERFMREVLRVTSFGQLAGLITDCLEEETERAR